MHDINIGDLVKFRDEHLYYATLHGCPREFVVTDVDNTGRTIDMVRWGPSYGEACWAIRVELTNGPW